MSPDGGTHTFPAMGGFVEVTIAGAGHAPAEDVERLFHAHEQALSRFRDDSELSALNASSACPFAASPLLFDAVSEAIAWACITDGLFDPTVIDVLESTGYDRPFEEMRRSGPGAVRAPRRTGDWRLVGLDFDRELISMPPDVRMDLGGIGKGYTVDRAFALLGIGANALINAGGDLYAAGDGPDGDGWYIGVQDPFAGDRDVVTLNVNDRGVATSGSTRRNWLLGDRRYHHLIDSRTRACSTSDIAAVTVIATTATQADVLAKTAFLLGWRRGVATLERFQGVECLAVTNAGDVVTSRGMAEYFA